MLMQWLLEFLIGKLEAEKFNMKYVIKQLESGSWHIQAYTRSGKANGNPLLVRTPDEAWKIYMMLNGYHYAEPFPILDEPKQENVA